MSTNLNYKQVANVSRRTWDVEAYEKRALDRANNTNTNNKDQSKIPETTSEQVERDGNTQEEFIPATAGAIGPQLSKRAFLKARTNKIKSLDAKIGSVEIVNPEAAATTKSIANDGGLVDKDSAVTKSGIGWHCKVCDCFLKDSLAYLDHINGRKHQRNLGYSMRVERSTQDQVVSRLAALVKAKEKTKKDSGFDRLMEEDEEDFNEIVKAKDEQFRRKKEERKRERKQRKKEKKEQQKATAKSSSHNSEQSTAEKFTLSSDNRNDNGIDPNIAAMMGFSGFGGGTKNR
mmetsp:Transcript_1461/g.3232  ORF Transcript_1461/g.3232 Transcript_1461/m.3232 type:complete len:289 (+) Transcript_1461:60-926(+)